MSTLTRMAAAGAICLLLSGCMTVKSWNRPNLSLGESPAAVRAAWGRPEQVSKSVSRDGVLEVWRYGDPRYLAAKMNWLTFWNGKLVQIAE